MHAAVERTFTTMERVAASPRTIRPVGFINLIIQDHRISAMAPIRRRSSDTTRRNRVRHRMQEQIQHFYWDNWSRAATAAPTRFLDEMLGEDYSESRGKWRNPERLTPRWARATRRGGFDSQIRTTTPTMSSINQPVRTSPNS